MASDFQSDIDAIDRIPAIPAILEVICRTTGMGFAAVARVTEQRWVCCAVRDEIAFGLIPGGELKVETTICNEIRQSLQAVVIDEVARDNTFRQHPTPELYGFQSYVSMPIMLPDGRMFGTLCAIDPRPARVNTPAVIGMFKLFAELVAFHLDANARITFTEARLVDERKLAAWKSRGGFATRPTVNTACTSIGSMRQPPSTSTSAPLSSSGPGVRQRGLPAFAEIDECKMRQVTPCCSALDPP